MYHIFSIHSSVDGHLGTILIEHLLNISGRLQTPKRTRKIPSQLGRMKERRKKGKRNQKRDQQPWREAESEGRSPHSEKLPHGWEISWDRKGPFGESKENAAEGLWKAGQSKNCTHGLHCNSVHSSLSRESPAGEGVWVLGSGVWIVDRGREQLLAVKRQCEGTGVRSSTTRKVCGKRPGHHRSKALLFSGAQGVGLPLQPPPHLLASASVGTGRETHLSRLTHPSSQGLLHLHKLWGPEHCPSQSLLRIQPWTPLPETGIWQCWQVLSVKACG